MRLTLAAGLAATVAALALVPAAFAGDPPADEEALARRIHEATLRAGKAIRASLKAPPPAPRADERGRGGVPRPRPPSRGHGYESTLVALALLRAGGPDERKAAEELLDEWWRQPGHGAGLNYQLALAISALEGTALHRLEPPHPTTVSRFESRPLAAQNLSRLEAATRALIDGRSTTEGGKGCAWTYSTAPIAAVDTATTRERPRAEGDTRTRPGDGAPRPGTGERSNPRPTTFDNSNTQFSVLALHDAARGGVPIPREVALEIAEHFLACATTAAVPEGKTVTGTQPIRFGYGPQGSTPAMTFAGLASLAVARELGAADPRIDAAIEGVLVGIGAFVADPGPGPRSTNLFDAYFLYSVEKAFDLLHLDRIDGRDWFAPLARSVLDAQGQDGLWGGDLVTTSLYVLFLSRATVGGKRVVDHRTTGKGAARSGQGDVFLPRTNKFVNVLDLVGRFAAPGRGKKPPLAAEVDEAIRALAAEGHGRDACLLGPLAELAARKDDRHEKAVGWLRELTGAAVAPEEALAAAARFEELAEDPVAGGVRATLRPRAERAALLPLRAFAATALASVPGADARDVLDAAEALAADPILATAAGARCARTYADALCALRCGGLPELIPGKPVTKEALVALVAAGRAQLRRTLDAEIERATAARAKQETDPAAWKAARERLAALGKPGLERLLEVAPESARASTAFALLRAATGELIPDDLEAWKVYVEGKS